MLAARTAEESLSPYRLLALDCSAMGEKGILEKHLAQAVYAALDEMAVEARKGHQQPRERSL
ncbi:MAG: hypothetical protein II206_11050 [Bacteroidaceae bacterium]|nr:hypothetical protein [Bacteroidaceae bacterium]